MFDIAWSEMVLIGAVALVVIGPKDLPKALRTVGQTVGKIRRMAAEFQGQFNEAMREAELADLKKQVEDVGGSVSSALNNDFKPIDPIKEFEAPKPDDAAKSDAPVSDEALKEAEAKLASLPPPEPLPPVEIAPEKPKRARKAKAEEATPVAEAAPVEATPAEEAAPAKPKRSRSAKVEAKGEAAEVEAVEPAAEAPKPARKRKAAAAKTSGEETSA